MFIDHLGAVMSTTHTEGVTVPLRILSFTIVATLSERKERVTLEAQGG